jgi:hypothetical protein
VAIGTALAARPVPTAMIAATNLLIASPTFQKDQEVGRQRPLDLVLSGPNFFPGQAPEHRVGVPGRGFQEVLNR